MKIALIAAAATGIQVGSALVASEAVVAEVGAGRLGFLRYAIALLFLLPFMKQAESKPIEGADLLPIALIGIGQFGLLIALLNLAVLYSSSARVSLVFATLPLLTIGVAWLLFKTRMGRTDFAAVLLTILGVAVLLGGDAWSGALNLAELGGLGCAALATLTGALCSALYRPYLRCYGVVKVSVIAMAASLLPLGVMALVEGSGTPISCWSVTILLLVGFVGLSSGVGYLMWLYALAHLPAGIVTAFLALSPVTAVTLSVLLLDVQATVHLFAALVFVIGGLAVLTVFAKDDRRQITR